MKTEIRVTSHTERCHHLEGLLAVIDEDRDVFVSRRVLRITKSIENDSNANKLLFRSVELARGEDGGLGHPQRDTVTK
jgi:hypothetical protein